MTLASAVLLALAVEGETEGAGPPIHPVERRASVASSDGALTVENKDTGKGGTMPDLITVVRWKDAKGKERAHTIEDEARVGWVEAIATFPTASGPVYVLVAEDKLATTTYSLGLFAFRLTNDTLEPAKDFLPAIKRAEERVAEVTIEYRRARGVDVFPRTLEARIDESARRITVSIFPDAATAAKPTRKPEARPYQSFVLVLEGDRLAVTELEETDREVLFPE